MASWTGLNTSFTLSLLSIFNGISILRICDGSRFSTNASYQLKMAYGDFEIQVLLDHEVEIHDPYMYSHESYDVIEVASEFYELPYPSYPFIR